MISSLVIVLVLLFSPPPFLSYTCPLFERKDSKGLINYAMRQRVCSCRRGPHSHVVPALVLRVGDTTPR